jgi:hypothetical protein
MSAGGEAAEGAGGSAVAPAAAGASIGVALQVAAAVAVTVGPGGASVRRQAGTIVKERTVESDRTSVTGSVTGSAAYDTTAWPR